MIYGNYIKGTLDRFIACLLIILFFPFFFGIILLLWATQGRGVFFVQQRSGRHLQHFDLYKFRTLTDDATRGLSMEKRGFTQLGKFMRGTGLDELPQLFNILRGEMSFVGPRPLPTEYEGKYQLSHLKRFDIKPGITGWAQVCGRNDIPWGKRFELDLWYVDHQSFLLDAKIIWLTALGLCSSFFINTKPHGNMEVFDGSNLT